MKFTYIILILLAVFSVSCSDNVVILTESQISDDIFYLQDEIKPYSGKCHIYYSNSEILKEELNFKGGILDGQRISYYKNGRIKRTGSYFDGGCDGKWTGFDKKGNKIFQAEYRNDILAGRFVSWYSTGVIKEKGYYANNSQISEWISYDESGMVKKKIIL